MIIAAAVDRCMATFAVRLSKTAATDEEIYAEANRACGPAKTKLRDTLRQELPTALAEEGIQLLDSQARPNFFKMLAHIRSDRAAGAGPTAPPAPAARALPGQTVYQRRDGGAVPYQRTPQGR